MPTAIQQNWKNKEVVVDANELIAFFKQTNNPWSGTAFPIMLVKNSQIKFIVKKPMATVNKVTDKSQRQDVEYIDTETRSELIENMYTSGQRILEVDLLADNGQDLKATAQYEVANNLDRQIANDDTIAVNTYAQIVEITEDNPIENLTAMLKGYDILFQLGNEANCKFNITNELYDKLVYLANNKGIITDNNIAQQLRLDGTKLYVKGIECNIVQDVYMIVDDQKMPWVLYTPKALKRYYLESANVYIEPVNDGKTPKMVLIAGEVTSDAFAYMTKDEKTSRWMLRGQYKTKPQLNTVIDTAELGAWQGEEDNPTTEELEAQVKSKNTKYVNGDATFSDIDGKKATATANPDKYQGTVNLTYTYTKKAAKS